MEPGHGPSLSRACLVNQVLYIPGGEGEEYIFTFMVYQIGFDFPRMTMACGLHTPHLLPIGSSCISVLRPAIKCCFFFSSRSSQLESNGYISVYPGIVPPLSPHAHSALFPGGTAGSYTILNSHFLTRAFEVVFKDKEYAVVYMDFSEAFDKVPHRRLRK